MPSKQTTALPSYNPVRHPSLRLTSLNKTLKEQSLASHLTKTGHFRDKSFEAIDCICTDNQTHNNQEKTHAKN